MKQAEESEAKKDLKTCKRAIPHKFRASGRNWHGAWPSHEA
jgi:hypothetical protein